MSEATLSFSPRSKARRALSRMFWRIGMRWFGVTARIGEHEGIPVERARAIDEIAARTSYPDHYRSDRVDTMRHPRIAQRRISEGRPLGDCDDHAAYWCACLLKSGLARVDAVYLAQLEMQRGGESIGHAFALFRVDGDLRWWAADYGPPSSGESERDACEQMARDHGARPVFAAWMRVELRADDGLRLRARGAGKAVWR